MEITYWFYETKILNKYIGIIKMVRYKGTVSSWFGSTQVCFNVLTLE